MPVSTKMPTFNPVTKKDCSVGGCHGENGGFHKHCHGGFGKKMLLTLVCILLAYGIVLIGALIKNNLKKFDFIGRADRIERTIVVNGYGKVSGNNDIAVTTIGFSNTDKDVATAQANNKKVMDQISAELKKLGVADKDLQSNYTIYPDYNYTQQKGQELIGYKVSNQLAIKIRDLSKIPQILGLAGQYGATDVSGLNFTIDDPENLKMDARVKALSDARTKAQYLSTKLGVDLGSVVSYNEYESGNNDIYSLKAAMPLGARGGPETVSSGSNDVVMNVSVTYEILSR